MEFIKDKDRALARAKRTKGDDHWATARYLRNQVNKMVRNAKANYIKEQLELCRGDSKKCWYNISKILPDSKKKLQVFNLNDTVTKTKVESEATAAYINKYFSDIGINLAKNYKEPWTYHGPFPISKFTQFRTNVEEVTDMCKSIDVSKSSSIANLSSMILKDAFLAIPVKVTSLLNLSLSCSTFPDKWKCATIIPLMKSGDPSDVSNLRPVSLLPLIGKLLERVVHKRLLKYLEENNLLDAKQGGFRPGHSTVDTIVQFTNDLYKGINENKGTVACFVDLKKAFDTVNHNILINKLALLGLSNSIILWVQSYLKNRTQRTLANNILSEVRTIECGVPQGSILGPLFFLVYINDMGTVFRESKYHLYADDLVLYCSKNTLQDAETALQNDFSRLYTWCVSNKLTINIKKTKAMAVGHPKSVKNLKQDLMCLG